MSLISKIRLLRASFGRWRERINPYKRISSLERRLRELQLNMYYEMGSPEVWSPKIMELEETMQYIIDKHCSVARFGDGEFELVDGRDMSFEHANSEMQRELINILQNPIPNCLCCVPNIFGSLARYTYENQLFWRRAALWIRPLLKKYLSKEYLGVSQNAVWGDPQISRAYLGVEDKSIARRIFSKWKEVFKGRNLLIVEGRFSRLGVGNDLFDGALSIRRIWCPALGAFEKYPEIKSAIKEKARKDDLILIALGATATILAYDLAKEGFWAVDAGHLDVEYVWMKMGVTKKTPIPGRYVNECSANGREMVRIPNEELANNVVACIL